MAWVFFNVIVFWWWEFGLSQVTHWTFALYLFVIVYASMFFLQAALLFPNDIEGYDGYGEYFIAERAWFFGIFALTEVHGRGRHPGRRAPSRACAPGRAQRRLPGATPSLTALKFMSCLLLVGSAYVRVTRNRENLQLLSSLSRQTAG